MEWQVNPGPLPQQYCNSFSKIKDLVTAVAYLHGRGISHDNIHCVRLCPWLPLYPLILPAQDNVLVDENSQVVLCDIGIDSVIRSIDTYCRCHSRYRYRAPELMIPSLVNVTPFTMLMADVWSLGRTVQEVRFTFKRYSRVLETDSAYRSSPFGALFTRSITNTSS